MTVALRSYCLQELPEAVEVTRALVTSCLQIFIYQTRIIKEKVSSHLRLPSSSPLMVWELPRKTVT